MRWIALTAGALLVALGVLAWLGRDASPEAAARPARSSAPGPRAERAAPNAAGADQLAAPEERTIVLETPPPALPEPQGIEEVGAYPLASLDFSPKYASLDAEQLERALQELESRVEEASDEELQRRFDAGLYREREFASHAERAVADWIRDVTVDGELASVHVVSGADGEGTRARVVSLPRAEFAALYALVDERDWLRRYLAPSDPDR